MSYFNNFGRSGNFIIMGDMNLSTSNGGPFQASNVFGGLGAGSYTVTVHDANNCTLTLANLVITEPAAITATTTIVNVNCNGANDGSITVINTAGGTPAYQYSLNGGPFQASNVFGSLGAGTYTVTVVDANQCLDIASTTINVPVCCDVLAAGKIGNGQDNCGPFDPAAITSSTLPSGGLGTVEYRWLQGPLNVPNTPGNLNWTVIPGATAATYDPGSITVTTYYLRQSRRNGCTIWSSTGESNVVAMNVNDSPVVTASTDEDVSCYGEEDGAVIAFATGGVGPYTYSWSNGEIGITQEELEGGTYTVTVTDANGCSISPQAR